MQILTVFVVLKHNRGRAEVMAVFNQKHLAEKFIEKMKPRGTFDFQESSLFASEVV